MTEMERKASGVWTEWARIQLSQEYPAAADCLIVFDRKRVYLLDEAGAQRGSWRVDQDFVPCLVGTLATLGQPPPKLGALDVLTDFAWSILTAVFSVPDMIFRATKKLFGRLF